MKKLLTAIACAALFLSASTVSAAVPCTTLTKPMSVGSTDAGTGGEVSKLQIFLASAGFFSGEATGYFGPITQSAVLSFQVAGGLEALGSVGEQTRAAIAAGSCVGGTVTVGSGQSSAAATVVPKVTSMTPSSGKIGDTVKLKGSGFVSGAIVIFGGGVVLPSVSSSGTRLTFIVPKALVPECAFDRAAPCTNFATAIAAGKHSVYVKTSGGESGSKKFTLKDSASSATTASGATVSNGSSVTTGSVSFAFPTVGQSNSSTGAAYANTSSSGSVSFPFPISGQTTSSTGAAYANTSTTGSVGFTFPVAGSSTSGSTSGSTSTSSPVISSVTPSVVVKEDIGSTDVVIRGDNFAAGSTVRIETSALDGGSATAQTVSGTVTADGTKITLRLPSSLASGSHTLKVQSGTKTSAGKTVTVSSIDSLTPVISSVSPSSGRAGTSVTITGSYFSSAATLRFGAGTIANSNLNVSSNREQITFTVPTSVSGLSVTSGGYAVRVIQGSKESNSKTFTIN